MIQPTNNLTLPKAFAPIISYKLGNMFESPPIILCLGSDKHTADCFGPLVGHNLKTMGVPTFVYGCLKTPLNSTTLPVIYKLLETQHKDVPVLAIDSMIGKVDDVGKLKLLNGGIYPGSGIGKDFPITGNVSLTAIITDHKSFSERQLVPLGKVYSLANISAKLVYNAIMQIYKKSTKTKPLDNYMTKMINR
ncbi:MAG: spore protease YyaC [Firmicutes bacterium]|nr:spore protease YyaC [Bacillota bacterium]MCL1953890.1 spore protease YyaC [Bacillota bacterium]